MILQSKGKSSSRCMDVPLFDAANLDTVNMRIDSIEDGNQICRRVGRYFSGFQRCEDVKGVGLILDADGRTLSGEVSGR